MAKSLYDKFFDILVARNIPKQPRLEGLEGNLIYLNDLKLLANVARVGKNKVWLRELPGEKYPGRFDFGNQAFRLTHLRSSPSYIFLPEGDFLQRHKLFVGFVSQPKGFEFEADFQFSYANNDSVMEKIMSDLDARFPKIDSASDIYELTKTVKSSFPFDKSERLKLQAETDPRMPLGWVVEDFGCVCRHLAGIEFAFLTLKGVDVSYVVGDCGDVNHAFLKASISNDSDACGHYLDPTAGEIFNTSGDYISGYKDFWSPGLNPIFSNSSS